MKKIKNKKLYSKVGWLGTYEHGGAITNKDGKDPGKGGWLERVNGELTAEMEPIFIGTEAAATYKANLKNEYKINDYLKMKYPNWDKFDENKKYRLTNLPSSQKGYEATIIDKTAKYIIESKPMTPVNKFNLQTHNATYLKDYNNYTPLERRYLSEAHSTKGDFSRLQHAYNQSIDNSIGNPFKKGAWTPGNIKQQGAKLKETLRIFPNASRNGKGVEDFISPLQWVADAGKSISYVPENIKEGEIGKAAANIALPLAIGALAGSSSPTTGDLINNLGNKYLPNAYKLNPFAFKPNPEMMYRGIGKEGMEDALESGVFRAKQNVEPSMYNRFDMSKQFKGTYYTPKFETANQYGKGFIAEVPKDATSFRLRYKGKGNQTWSQIADENIPINKGRILEKDWLQGYKEVPKPQQTFKSEINWRQWNKEIPENKVLNKTDDVTKKSWQTQELPGLHLKSTMEEEAVSKIVEPKTGLINTEQALAIIAKESGGADKVALIRQGLGNNIPKKMDYNEFRKIVQDQLIPLERQFATDRSGYGIDRLGYYNTDDAYSISKTWEQAGYTRPLENQTLILGNKNKFGRGSSAHGNPDETLGHIHFLRDAETPDVLTVTQIQSDAFQGTHRIMPKTQQEALEKVNKLKEEGVEIKSMFGDGKESSNAVLANYEKHLQLDEATAKNFTQKQLLDKNHQERYLQELVDYAGKRGDVNKVRVPTSETAAKVQGYDGKNTEELLEKVKEEGLNINEPYEVFLKHWKDNDIAEYGGRNITPENEKEVKLVYDFLTKDNKGLLYKSEHQTILKKYAEQPKTIKKLFGEEPKIVTDSKGNTWYEFDIPKKFKEGRGEIKAFGLIPPAIGIGAAIQSQNQNKEYKNGGAIGNNGMFDMTNPNIYKTIIGGVATGTLGKQAVEKQEFGGKIKVLDTKSQLDDAIKNYIPDTGLDNNMTAFLNSIIDKKGLLKAMNKYALSLTPAIGAGISAYYVPQLDTTKNDIKTKASGGWLDKH